MKHSAQAGARRVIPLVTAGLGIGIAIMAFAPAASSPPTGMAVGVHEANYETDGEWSSPGRYSFRVHTAVKLRNRMELEYVADLLDASDYAQLRDTILAEFGGEIRDGRALSLLALMAEPIDTTKMMTRRFKLDREYRGVPGHYFHVYYEFPIPDGDMVEIPELLWGGGYVDVVTRVRRQLEFEPPPESVIAKVLAEVGPARMP